MKENSTEEIKQMAQEKAQQAKTAAKEKLDQVKNMSADEAKELAKEKAEQAKKLAAEKLEQMKKMSADDAKKMAEEKMANLKKMPMINKISYGAATAAIVLGMVFMFSGESSSSISSDGKWELFTYNGECEEGDLVEKKDQRTRELQCKIGEREYTVLDQGLYADGKVSYEKAYDLAYNNERESAETRYAFQTSYNAKGEIKGKTTYVNKFNNSDDLQSMTTENYIKYDNGKMKYKTTYAVKQNDDGRWVSLMEKDYRGFTNGKSKKEVSYEIKKNKDGTWASLEKSKVKFNDAGQKTDEETYAMQQNKEGKWYAAPVKIYADSYSGINTDLVLKENSNGRIDSYTVAKKSVDWNETKPHRVMATYEVVQDANGQWKSLLKSEKSSTGGSFYHTENVIKKDSKSGNYSALATLKGYYNRADGKNILSRNTSYKVVENDSGRWVSLPIKEEKYNRKGVLQEETTYVVLKNAAGDHDKYKVSSKYYSKDSKLSYSATYETKQNDDGKWVSVMLKEEKYSKGALHKETTYVVKKSASGDHKSFKVSSKEYRQNTLQHTETYEIKQNDSGTWSSLLVDYKSYEYDRKQQRYTNMLKRQDKYELFKDDRGWWRNKRIKKS